MPVPPLLIHCFQHFEFPEFQHFESMNAGTCNLFCCFSVLCWCLFFLLLQPEPWIQRWGVWIYWMDIKWIYCAYLCLHACLFVYGTGNELMTSSFPGRHCTTELSHQPFCTYLDSVGKAFDVLSLHILSITSFGR